MSSQQPVVNLSSVTKQFGKGGVTALQDVDLEIRPGEFISLIGPSGCGKSTLLRVVGDLIQPTAGTVEVDEMTRERLNLELLRIWQASGSTVIFVTHSISEAVFLSTRVVVMSPRPGRITGIVDIDLPQPRTGETREERRFFELVTAVRDRLRAGGADL